MADNSVPFSTAVDVDDGGGRRHSAEHRLCSAALPYCAALEHDNSNDVPHGVGPVLV
jgi:hypothetical protein